MSNKVFKNVGGLKPRLSVFDLSYEKKFTCDMGQLIPVMCDEVVPGDFFKIGNQAVIRFQPMVAPLLHEVNMFVHYFFVPYRLLWPEPSGWQTFISGGVQGTDTTAVLPKWNPTDYSVGSLWDYLGFDTHNKPASAWYPIAFPQAAYNLVWNEYYRDETLQTALTPLYGSGANEAILYRNWQKDYFTSSLPWQQRGTAPALPITGTTSAVWDSASFVGTNSETNNARLEVKYNALDSHLYEYVASGDTYSAQNARSFMNANTVDLSTATAFSISDLRLAFQVQKWLERNARSGARYTEFLKAHFGVAPRDERLQRPEYIGGSKSPVIFSEVLQTSATASQPTPQGNLAGHGIAISDSYCGKYKVSEYGLIIGIMSVMPVPQYQSGNNRQWLRRTKYDFYFPEFANLSEQGIITTELFNANDSGDSALFGYQGRYDEMRYKPNLTCGKMRTTYDYWHLARQFADHPLLNSSFISTGGDTIRKDFLAVPTEPAMLVSFGNIIKAFRPIPVHANPGLIDHN